MNIKYKKHLVLIVLMLSVNVAQAAFLSPGATGEITVTSGCFSFGVCAVDGLGTDDLTDNATNVIVGTSTNVSSGIAGDGVVGRMSFTVGADGNSLDIISYNMDTYIGTPLGDFGTRISDTSNAIGNIDDLGNMTLDLTGRTAGGQFHPFGGEVAWNIESYTATDIPSTGLYALFTSGNSQSIDPDTGSVLASLNGTALVGNGDGSWSGTLVSASNVGSLWGAFDGTPYSEIYNISVNVSAVPLPASIWLFVTGIFGLIGFSCKNRAV